MNLPNAISKSRAAGLAALAAGLSLAIPAPAANWTDRKEYDLVLAVRSEPSPQKRLALLDQWKAKYPKTELRQVRRELYFAIYQSLADGPHMLDVAREILADQPDNFLGLYWTTLLAPQAKTSSPDLWNAAEKAANQLLAGLNGYFSPGRKPSTTSDSDWLARKNSVELLAHRALGWIQWQRAAYPAAEQEFTACLQRDPRDAEISAWFGTVLALQKEPEKRPPALWHLARAGSLHDNGALPEAQRREVNTLFERLYTSYHGAAEGLDQLRAASAESAFPPADFKVESAEAAAARKQDEELTRTNPQLAAWLRIRRRLEAPDGETYFSESLKNSPLPKLKGTLVRSSPDKTPNEIVLGISSPTEAEVVLKLASPLPNQAEAGTVLEFEGTPDSFTRSPFTLTLNLDPAKLEGWPAAPPARVRK